MAVHATGMSQSHNLGFVQRRSHVRLVVIVDHLGNQGPDVGLEHRGIDVRERLGESRVEQRPSVGRLERRSTIDRLFGDQMPECIGQGGVPLRVTGEIADGAVLNYLVSPSYNVGALEAMVANGIEVVEPEAGVVEAWRGRVADLNQQLVADGALSEDLWSELQMLLAEYRGAEGTPVARAIE